MHACTCMHAHACMHMHACTCMHAHACMHMHACTCMHAHACMHMHHRNIHCIAIEIFKVKLGIAPSFMNEIFAKRVVPSNSVVTGLRHNSEFYNPHNPKTVYNGTETLRSLGPKVWDILPMNLKNSTNLEMFKRNIKIWIPKNCPCRLCRPYITGLGFI